MRLKYLPQADADLDDIYDHIARDDTDAAARLIARIVGAVRRLGDYPESGRERPEAGEGARSIVVGRYLVFYRFSLEDVEVARVVHGSRDLVGLLEQPIVPDNRQE